MSKFIIFYRFLVLKYLLSLVDANELKAIEDCFFHPERVADEKCNQLLDAIHSKIAGIISSPPASHLSLDVKLMQSLLAVDHLFFELNKLSALTPELMKSAHEIAYRLDDAMDESADENMSLLQAIKQFKEICNAIQSKPMTDDVEKKEEKGTKKRKFGAAFRFFSFKDESAKDDLIGIKKSKNKKRKKNPDKSNYYLKINANDFSTIENDAELLSQEFARIFDVSPKTRFSFVLEKGSIGIASKEIKEMKKMNDYKLHEIKENIASGKWQGLEVASVLSLVMGDIDYSFGNIGISEDQRILKFDGNRNFPELIGFDEVKTTIDEEDIQSLPYRKFVDSSILWLNQKGSIEDLPIEQRIACTETMRRKINATIMSIVVLPEAYIDKFINNYASCSAYADTLKFKLLNNIHQLREAATKNASFCGYMQSGDSKADLMEFYTHLTHFASARKRIVANDVPELLSQLQDNYEFLRVRILPKQPVFSAF